MKQQVNIKKLDDRAVIPTYGTAFSAGADLYACMDAALLPKKAWPRPIRSV